MKCRQRKVSLHYQHLEPASSQSRGSSWWFAQGSSDALRTFAETEARFPAASASAKTYHRYSFPQLCPPLVVLVGRAVKLQTSRVRHCPRLRPTYHKNQVWYTATHSDKVNGTTVNTEPYARVLISSPSYRPLSTRWILVLVSDGDRVKRFRLTLKFFYGVSKASKVIYFFNSDFKFFEDASEFSVCSFYVVFNFS